MNFLLVYDRTRGEILREEEFSDAREAMEARFAAEADHQGRDVEVIVLGARSRDDLLRTHGRYFYTMDQLIDRFSASVRAATA
ncbi:hypothetical protein [Allosalinactinospora lopnorensis]|uniref:hypothetical protein n=1 Tax=Allosalinactinospora lopnorensis TaxID=1352348 RepID=UPI0012E278ED|nr:hypothetical protein [Allosalinactinospora lopnorensis]